MQERKTRYLLRETSGKYYSRYDYKQIREPLCRAKTWASLASLETFLQTDNYRRRAKYSKGDLVIEEMVADTEWRWAGQVHGIKTIRTIPAAEVAAAAAIASTRAERRARGLRN